MYVRAVTHLKAQSAVWFGAAVELLAPLYAGRARSSDRGQAGRWIKTAKAKGKQP